MSLRQRDSPSGGGSVQAGPPQAVRSVDLEACRQDRVVTHYAKPPAWRGQRRERRREATQHSSSHHREKETQEEEEVERKTGVSATGGGRRLGESAWCWMCKQGNTNIYKLRVSQPESWRRYVLYQRKEGILQRKNNKQFMWVWSVQWLRLKSNSPSSADRLLEHFWEFR